MLLSLEEEPIELEGTLKVIIKSNVPFDMHLHDCSSSQYVLLSNGERSCGAIVERIEVGDNLIFADKYLRIFLQARIGDKIEMEFDNFPSAESIEIIVTEENHRDGLMDLIRDSLIGKPFSVGQSIPLFFSPLIGQEQVGEVGAIQPEGIVVVVNGTNLSLRTGKLCSNVGVTYKNIGGLAREIEKIREIVEFPLRHTDVFQSLGIIPPKGIILYGPPGTGKTLIAKALANEVGASVFTIQGPEIISSWYGGSEQNLREVFNKAKEKAPAIVLIDEMDSIAPSRDHTHGEVERRVVATLLTLMDGLSELKDVIVIGTTNTINSIDAALRRPGRFEYEIHIGVPDTNGRKEILEIHTRRMPLSQEVNLDKIASKTYGFIGADISLLCRQAAYCALKRVYQGKVVEIEKIKKVSSLIVTHQDFEDALTNIKPSAMREVMAEVPKNVSWDSIGGLDDTKQVLIENVVLGINNRQAFLMVGIKPAKGMLLYGPPGTGKTLLAKVVARESGANFIAVSSSEVRSKWFGESEEKIRSIFSKAREVSPCIILFDELDAIASVRGAEATRLNDSIVNQLLSEMDGIENNDNIFVIGITNNLKAIDYALLRPGRFDSQVYVPLPDARARKSIFAIHLNNKPKLFEVSIDDLSYQSEGFSGADIAEVCRLATLEALRKNEFKPDNIQLQSIYFIRAINDMRRTQSQLKEVGF